MQPGTVIKHYEIIRKLGEGGMGAVFLARDTRLGRLVAIKFLLEHSGSAVQRFLIEAQATAQCRHENIVVIYDLGEADGYPYMVLEYIEGKPLRAVIVPPERSSTSTSTQDGSLPTLDVAVELLLPVARALACAHEMGIVHRDLKPENILLADTGRVKVLDFGIAKQISLALTPTLPASDSFSHDLGTLTQDGALMGTLPYMAPEQWLKEEIDARTDLWAVGIILFELLTGEHPLAPITWAKLTQIVDFDKPMPSILEKRPDVGPLAEVITRCLKKRKEERIGSAKELVESLEQINAKKRAVPVIAEDENPFAGLSAFQESDAARFFGRDHEIAALLGKLRNQQLVVIAGPSGAGKSSFVRAGIIPGLKRASRHSEVFVIRPGRRPLAALADVLAFLQDTSNMADSDEADPKSLADTLKTEPGHLGARLRARCRKRGGDHRILLFVDQLEELYTLGIEPVERAAFCACLEGVADDASSPLRVIMTIRADFLDRLSEDRRFLTDVTRGLVFLPPVTREGLRDALQKPLEAARYRLEDEALCEEMLDGLASTKSPLPLLQFTATKLWEARDRELRLLTRTAYRALGGVAGALSTHADSVISSLSASEQHLARAILTRLVTPERTRAIVRMDELMTLHADDVAVEHVVLHLVSARLLLIEAVGDSDGKTVELTHESLIDRWTKLGQWLDEDAQDAQFLVQVRSAAQQWEKNGEAEGFLWRDRAALEAGQWLGRRRAERGAGGDSGLARREERYLDAVVGLAERTRRWRRRIAAAAFGGMLAIAIVVSVLAVRAREQAERADAQAVRADEQAKQAQEEARQSRNLIRMAAAAARKADSTMVLALLREIEAGPTPKGWDEQVRAARNAGVASVVLPHKDGNYFAAFSPDGQRIASTSLDSTVRIWRADGSGEPLTLTYNRSLPTAVAFSPDGRLIAVTSEADNTVRIRNADGTGDTLILRGHKERVTYVAFSPDGHRVVSSSHDKTIRIWKADGAGEPIILRGHEDKVESANVSPDGKRIVSTSWDKTIRVWNADDTGVPLVLKGHQDAVLYAAFSPDGERIVSASQDKTIRIWNADGTGEPRILRGHENGVIIVSFSPDGHHIISGSADQTVRIWTADLGEPLRILRGRENMAYAFFSPDGHRFCSGEWQGKTVRVWDFDTSPNPLVLREHENSVQSAEFSPDGRRIVSASFDKTVRVWSSDGTGQPLTLRGHDGVVNTASFSPDGQRIVSASQDGTIRVWRVDGKTPPLVLRGHEGDVRHAVFTPDGQRIGSASMDKTVRIWPADGTSAPLVLRHDAEVTAVSFSPDGQRLVTTSGDNTVRVWNADGTGQPLILRGHDATSYGAQFSPDGRRIVSGSWDKTLRIWNADGTGEPVVLRGHELPIHLRGNRIWSPDGTRLLSNSIDGIVRVWNADGTGEPIVLHPISSAIVESASWSPDGTRIVTASQDKTIVVWSDLAPFHNADDPRLWTATTYCMPLDIRQSILGFSEEQSRKDLERCQRKVQEARAAMGITPGK